MDFLPGGRGSPPPNYSETEGAADNGNHRNNYHSEYNTAVAVTSPKPTKLPPINQNQRVIGGDHREGTQPGIRMEDYSAFRPPALPPIAASSIPNDRKSSDETSPKKPPADPDRSEDGREELSNQVKILNGAELSSSELPRKISPVEKHDLSTAQEAERSNGCFDNRYSLLFCLCLCTVTQGFLINGILSVSVTTLERRFHLSSTQSGVFSSMYDIAVLAVLMPLCHYGGRGHKGRWIAVGMIIMGLGSVICTIPQFISEPYHNGTSESVEAEVCRKGADNGKESCLRPKASTLPYLLLLLGQLFHGIGASPIYTLGITYLDENVPQQSSPVYLGIFLGSSVVGPVLGYTLGGFFLSLYGDIGKVSLKSIIGNSTDQQWYGAWWLGYLMAAVMSFIVAIPLFAFPCTLSASAALRKQDVNQAHHVSGEEDALTHVGFGNSFSEFKRTVRRLFKNSTFLLLISVDCIEALGDTGVVFYMPKIIEHFFMKARNEAGILTGICAVPAGLVGILLGGILSKKLKLKCSGMIMFALIVNFFCFWLMLVFQLHCEQPFFAGVNTVNKNVTLVSGRRFDDTCNANCSCQAVEYSPVCHNETRTQYFSACHAGCSGRLDNTTFTSCACVPREFKEKRLNATVQHGICESKACNLLPLFIALLGGLVACVFLTSIPIQQAELRSVPFGQRTIAVGIRWIGIRLLGTIPGPIMFGRLVDGNCLAWDAQCGADSKACVWYNTGSLSYIMAFTGMFMKGLIMLLLFLAWKLYRPVGRTHPMPEPEPQRATVFS